MNVDESAPRLNKLVNQMHGIVGKKERLLNGVIPEGNRAFVFNVTVIHNEAKSTCTLSKIRVPNSLPPHQISKIQQTLAKCTKDIEIIIRAGAKIAKEICPCPATETPANTEGKGKQRAVADTQSQDSLLAMRRKLYAQ